MRVFTEQEVALVVAEALEKSIESVVPSQRLLPFTEAQLTLMRDFVSRALTNLLLDRSDE